MTRTSCGTFSGEMASRLSPVAALGCAWTSDLLPELMGAGSKGASAEAMRQSCTSPVRTSQLAGADAVGAGLMGVVPGVGIARDTVSFWERRSARGRCRPWWSLERAWPGYQQAFKALLRGADPLGMWVIRVRSFAPGGDLGHG